MIHYFFLIEICMVFCVGSTWICSADWGCVFLLCSLLVHPFKPGAQFWSGWKGSVLFPLLFFPRVDFSHGGVEELLSHYANRSGALSQLPLPRSQRDDMHFTVPYLPLFFTGQNGIMSLVHLLFWALIELIPSL